ncbi:efflux transporter outer membrane subunit [Asticcacaulis sp. ZE23SCel15]|uniref:efflux transporter outer membrane subunit n=1 Tax=Asticcacaulis sp. ZE23SCel15 TaxID=3059027 RepID=UPI00265F13DD|nr:efflux transporter outer membrane subunit [Asticcacaulis sp. ZE23SCel15]WKL58439.1 efflux transporter outer membrane subunit [Asticcacaulis sp. ZE23SCel15]
MLKSITTFSLAALLLAGCATEPLNSAALTAPPPAFKGEAAPATAATPPLAMGQWWKVFADPTLDDLIERSLARNTDIRIAAARLEQSKALVKSARSSLFPQAGIGYGASRATEVGQDPKASTLHSAGIDLSYEVDITGKLFSAAKAARLDAQASEALLADTRLLIAGTVAETYFALRALDEERAIVRETLTAYRTTLDVTQRRFEAGDVAELDVARLQTEVSSNEFELLALDRQRAQIENALAVLTGEMATTFDVESQSWASQPWAGHVPVVPAGIPSDVLKRRPDVQAAELSMQAAQRRVGIAKAAWFPSLTLTASGGYASSDLGDLFEDAGRNWSLTGLLAQAIFDGGRRNAGIALAKGDLEIAFAGYQQQVLVAFADVEDQLAARQTLEAQARTQTDALNAATRALNLSQSRYRNGYVSQLDLLDAQRSELRTRRQALQVKAAQYQSSVRLIRALGGDWNTI